MGKIINLEQAEKTIKNLKEKEEKIILTGGDFDILHIGHIEFLEKSKKLGGTVFVMLENDKSIQKRKGAGRPINKQKNRAKIISCLIPVDFVILLPHLSNDKDYYKIVKRLSPDIISITKGDPYTAKKTTQARLANANLIEVMGRKRKFSSTKTITLLDN